MNRANKRKIIIVTVIAVLVLTLFVVIIMPRIFSKRAAGPAAGTMENVNPTEYIAEPVDLGLSVKWASFNVGAFAYASVGHCDKNIIVIKCH